MQKIKEKELARLIVGEAKSQDFKQRLIELYGKNASEETAEIIQQTEVVDPALDKIKKKLLREKLK